MTQRLIAWNDVTTRNERSGLSPDVARATIEVLKVSASSPIDTSVSISGAVFTTDEGQKFGIVSYDKVSAYTNGTINFSTGIVTGGGSNFTPYTPSAPSRYFKYAIALAYDDTITVFIPDGDSASASSAPAPSFIDGLPLAIVTVQDNGSGGSGTILPVSDILRFVANPSGVFYRTRNLAEFTVASGLTQTTFSASTFSWSSAHNSRDIIVRVNNLYQEQDPAGSTNYDYRKISTTQIAFTNPVKGLAYVTIEPLRPTPAGGGGGGGGGGSSLQSAYDGGAAITTTSSNPIVVTGPSGQKLAVFNGDITVTGIVDPKGVTFSRETSCPLGSEQDGIWIDNEGNLQFKNRNSATSLKLNAAAKTYSYNGAGSISQGRAVAKVSTEIRYADKTNDSLCAPIGILLETVTSGHSGVVQTSGMIPDGIITSGAFIEGSLPSDGKRIWLATNGQLTITPPAELSDHHQVVLGVWDSGGLELQLSYLGKA